MNRSSYLNFLPPVLWQTHDDPAAAPDDGSQPPEFGLGTFLLGFEKLLTGLPDGVPVPHRSGEDHHVYDSIAATIGQIITIFDPWHTPAAFLPWLASWVGLEFPTLQNRPLWDEYQQRKATSDIARIHRMRGLKKGLNLSLDLFGVTSTRPRVAIDDGNKLLTATPLTDRVAEVTALVSQGPVVDEPIRPASKVTVNGLVRPRCIATAHDGTIFVGDFGAAGTVSALPSRVWRLDATGTATTVGTPPVPQPLVADTALANVSAIAWSPSIAGRKETLYFLDGKKALFSVEADYTATAATPVSDVGTVRPVAMAVDDDGNVLILDRGNTGGDPAIPKVVVVRPGTPPTITNHTLKKGVVVEPLSILVHSDGSLIIGDGQAQDGTVAGNLVKVTRTADPTWTGTPLLPTADLATTLASNANPLVTPTAVVAADHNAVYVLDAGLRPWATGDLLLTVARPAAVFRVDLADLSVRRVTENGNLVFPTGMAAAPDGRLIMCDPGQLESPQQDPVLSRLSPFRFCVAVHFENASLPEDETERTRVIGRVSTSIRGIVDQLRPAHTLATMVIAG